MKLLVNVIATIDVDLSTTMCLPFVPTVDLIYECLEVLQGKLANRLDQDQGLYCLPSISALY